MYTWCRPAPSWDLMAVGPWSSRSFPVVMIYQDLSHCYHYLKCQVLKANGLPIKSAKFTGWEATFGPMNLLFHSLFRQVDLVMNNILVATNGDTYLYGAYLTMLAGYGCQAKKTWLKHPEGWAPARQKFTMCGKTEAWSSI